MGHQSVVSRPRYNVSLFLPVPASIERGRAPSSIRPGFAPSALLGNLVVRPFYPMWSNPYLTYSKIANLSIPTLLTRGKVVQEEEGHFFLLWGGLGLLYNERIVLGAFSEKEEAKL